MTEMEEQAWANWIRERDDPKVAGAKPNAYAVPIIPIKCSVPIFEPVIDMEMAYHGNFLPAKK